MNRKAWIAMVAKLVHPLDPAFAAGALAAMLPLLADLPDAAFCAGSLEHVGTVCRRLPSYADLRAALSAWWMENRPRLPELPAPAPVVAPPATEAECEAVATLVRAFVAERSWNRPSHLPSDPPRAKPAHLSRGALLAQYERLAAEGDAAAATRAATLRAAP